MTILPTLTLVLNLGAAATPATPGGADSAVVKAALADTGTRKAAPAPEGPAPRVTLIYRDVPLIAPSNVSAQFGKYDPAMAMEINQGFEIKLDSWIKLGATYSGTFDFRNDEYSRAVIPQRQNPSAFAAVMSSEQDLIWSVPVGIGMEANGMPIGSDAQFQGMSGMNADNCRTATAKCGDDDAQDHASMDWTYLWVRGFVTNATARNRHELVFNASAEYRYFLSLNDNNIFVYTKNQTGYQHYDGVRLALGASFENFVFQTHGQIGTKSPVYGAGGAMISFRLPEEIRKTYPIEPFVSFDYGYGVSMARYFESQAKVNVGVIVRNPVIHAFWD